MPKRAVGENQTVTIGGIALSRQNPRAEHTTSNSLTSLKSYG